MIESIEAALFPIVCKINEYLSNYILVFLLLGIGFWYSIKTRFVQLRCFKEGWNSATALGMTMRLLNMSLSSQTRSLDIIVPRKMNTSARTV